MDTISLSQLVTDIQITLQEKYVGNIWIVAEISELNINRNGHCYLELIEKDTISDKIIAKSRATIWAYTFRTIKPYFESVTGETLRAGLKVMLSVSVEFHEVYGFSLNVSEINPEFTLGDMARKRIAIIERLDNEGILDMNKQLQLPLVPQRIAVISSDTAAGYGDFLNQLSNNSNGYKFFTELFPAIMQGEKSAESIINAFNTIFEQIDNFDIVVLIRGGGSKSDLSCFDDYELAYYITQFPLPVLTGIGHERDDTIADIVAHTKLKTPTAVAEFLISQIKAFDYRLDESQAYLNDLLNDIFNKNEFYLEKLSHRLKSGIGQLLLNKERFLAVAKADVINKTRQLLKNKETQLSTYNKDIIHVAKGVVNREITMCNLQSVRLKKWLDDYFRKKEQRLQFLEQKADLVNPQNILERGFAWVTHNNEIITDSKKLKKNDEIKIQLAKGSVKADVK